MGKMSNLFFRLDTGVTVVDDVDQTIYDMVHDKNEELKSLRLDELLELPRFSIDRRNIGKHLYALATWHQEKDSKHIFITQCKRYIFLGYGRMYTAGFSISEKGLIENASEMDLSEYK